MKFRQSGCIERYTTQTPPRNGGLRSVESGAHALLRRGSPVAALDADLSTSTTFASALKEQLDRPRALDRHLNVLRPSRRARVRRDLVEQRIELRVLERVLAGSAPPLYGEHGRTLRLLSAGFRRTALAVLFLRNHPIVRFRERGAAVMLEHCSAVVRGRRVWSRRPSPLPRDRSNGTHQAQRPHCSYRQSISRRCAAQRS